MTKFSSDLKAFLTYLVGNEEFSTSQYVTSIGAGTEPFTGSGAVLSVSDYSVVINLGSGTGTTTSAVTTPTTTSGGSTPTTSTSSGTGAALYGQCGNLLLCYKI